MTDRELLLDIVARLSRIEAALRIPTRKLRPQEEVALEFLLSQIATIGGNTFTTRDLIARCENGDDLLRITIESFTGDWSKRTPVLLGNALERGWRAGLLDNTGAKDQGAKIWGLKKG